MREVTISELELVIGGMYQQEQIVDGGGEGGGYYYGSSSLYEAGNGDYIGVAYQSDSAGLQAEAQALSIDWEVNGEVGNGGWKVTAKVSGKC